MKKLRTYDIFINESVSDLMTPKSIEDIRKSIGEKRYNVYKSLYDVLNSIKPPFTAKINNNRRDGVLFTDEMSLIDIMEYSLAYINIEIRFLDFRVSFDGNVWQLNYNYQTPRTILCKTWNEIWDGIIDACNKSFNREISLLQKRIDLDQENIDEINELLSKINDNSVNEGVRDKMTPIDPESMDEAIKKTFEIALKKHNYHLTSEMYFDYWEEMAQKYCLLDYYYMYENEIFMIDFDDEEENYVLMNIKITADQFEEKLKTALDNLNRLRK